MTWDGSMANRGLSQGTKCQNIKGNVNLCNEGGGELTCPFMWVQLAQDKTCAKDHHGGMGSLNHGRLGVQFPSSYHGPGYEVLGSKLGTSGTCLEATLGVTSQNPFGQLDVVMRWDFGVAHYLGDNPRLSQGQLSVVLWDTLGWLRVVSKVTFCNWGTSNNGAMGVKALDFGKSTF